MSTVANDLRKLLADVEQVERERDEAQREIARLARDNDRQCDRINELEVEARELRAENASLRAENARLQETLEEWQRGLRTRLGAA